MRNVTRVNFENAYGQGLGDLCFRYGRHGPPQPHVSGLCRANELGYEVIIGVARSVLSPIGCVFVENLVIALRSTGGTVGSEAR